MMFESGSSRSSIRVACHVVSRRGKLVTHLKPNTTIAKQIFYLQNAFERMEEAAHRRISWRAIVAGLPVAEVQ
jgi:hypothetical protein